MRITNSRFAGQSAACAAAACAAGVAAWMPHATDVFVMISARLAGWLTGVPAVRAAEGWALAPVGQGLMITGACSATDFYVIAAALLGWCWARETRTTGARLAGALGAVVLAAPFAWAVNALRLVAVAHAHRWVIPRFPDAYGAFLHLLTGVAVFLPALVALNVLFEIYERSRASNQSTGHN